MKRVLMASLIGVLVAANAWRWTGPGPENDIASMRDNSRSGVSGAESVGRLPILSPPQFETPGRNLFASIKRTSQTAATTSNGENEFRNAKRRDASPKPNESDLARQSAARELRAIRLAGTVRRGDTQSAYLIDGGEAFTVSAGERINGRYRVVAVQKDGIVLHDPDTGIRQSLSLDDSEQ